MTYSPIIIFGFDRPSHLKNMVSSLLNNSESKDSEVFFFIDGPTEKTDLRRHEEVIKFANEKFPFKSQNTIIREKTFHVK